MNLIEKEEKLYKIIEDYIYFDFSDSKDKRRLSPSAPSEVVEAYKEFINLPKVEPIC
ncbi:hypothetical protein [Aerococcus urinae]|uniref:Uncharacterized protein n=1 Tax=Aerococcus urinae TaxID=1376 RepID=A0A7T2RQP6_9LACT|nr:hypothetical protein [Aerococcus urinae]MCY3031863.1 hypothetical protein [Aerococcus urinae]MCY3037143.1 hypothetical protein [Aerococcus urinae]MCY3043910.1 hypothetical protein [Aerococcus urinae]MCY3046301.1 hypothetical protein [Aerococcus urinae]MCY3047365.1 hypothetical protein [Aerococcus urinae]